MPYIYMREISIHGAKNQLLETSAEAPKAFTLQLSRTMPFSQPQPARSWVTLQDGTKFDQWEQRIATWDFP